MIPAGYMAKRVAARPESVKALNVERIYSVADCISADFADFVPFWRHNGYWFFDSVEIIRLLAAEQGLDLSDCQYFYYEVFELEFDDEAGQWRPFQPEPTFTTQVAPVVSGQLEGFDVVTFSAGTAPECSPLSCNALAETLPANRNCLFASLEEARRQIEIGAFKNGEPGPYRIFSVYSCDPGNLATAA